MGLRVLKGEEDFRRGLRTISWPRQYLCSGGSLWVLKGMGVAPSTRVLKEPDGL